MDDIDAQNILAWKSYFEEKGKEVYIGEYGFRTWKPESHWAFGMVSDDTVKAKLIKQYLGFACDEFEIVTYFAMYDGDGGWGLLDSDGTMRLSGWATVEWLIHRER